MRLSKDSPRAVLDRALKTYFEQLFDRLAPEVRAAGESTRQLLKDESASLQAESDRTRGALVHALDETRGTLQRDLVQARDEVRGTVELFRHAFDNFQANVEPRVVSIEARLDSLELRMMTLESEQKDYEERRGADMESVRQEAGSLRDDVRADIVEMTRMLRMQGDAADQVAEALGRTLARLSAEVDLLAGALGGLSGTREAAGQPA